MSQMASEDADDLFENYRNTQTGEGRHIVWVPAGTGPAPDPVEVWDDHQDSYTVEHKGTTDDTAAYLITEI